jgi:hypothetical protein
MSLKKWIKKYALKICSKNKNIIETVKIKNIIGNKIIR